MSQVPGSPLDRYFTRADLSERHETSVRAPASIVYEAARNFDLGSLWQVQAIFRLRARMMGARKGTVPSARGFVDEAMAMGWGRMEERPGALFVAGASCRPWVADVVFHPLTAEGFASFAEPKQVKIAWTLEVGTLDSDRSRFVTETRAVATDEEARKRFRRYLGIFRVGIVAIRWMMVPAVRRRAERRWRTGLPAS